MRPFGHPGATQPVAAGGQHHPACQLLQRAWAGPSFVEQIELHQSVGAGLQIHQAVLVAQVQAQHLSVPAQVVGPLQAWDLVQRLPGGKPELGLEPGAEGQRRKAQRRAGQFLG